MTHRIVVLGAGYAGLGAANRLTGMVGPDVQVTMLNATDHFVERVRLHQLAAGQRLPRYSLSWMFRGSGVRFVQATASAIDLDTRTVSASGGEVFGYDTLVYALGSFADRSAPGVADHALAVGDQHAAMVTRERVAKVADSGRLTVVGGGLTGLETATELAEAHPRLEVRLMTDGFGDWLSHAGERHLRRDLDRMGVELLEGIRVTQVRAGELETAAGRQLTDETLWATGFSVPPLAAEAGLAVDSRGRVRVDATLRSLSHPDVYAIGDAAAATTTPGGEDSRMACQTGLPMGIQAAEIIAGRLAGVLPRESRVRYVYTNVSLGRRNGVTQFSHADDSPRRLVMTGRASAWFKEQIFRSTIAMLRRPRYVPRPPAPRAEIGPIPRSGSGHT